MITIDFIGSLILYFALNTAAASIIVIAATVSEWFFVLIL
jgi:hypothetical protein